MCGKLHIMIVNIYIVHVLLVNESAAIEWHGVHVSKYIIQFVYIYHAVIENNSTWLFHQFVSNYQFDCFSHYMLEYVVHSVTAALR